MNKKFLIVLTIISLSLNAATNQQYQEAITQYNEALRAARALYTVRRSPDFRAANFINDIRIAYKLFHTRITNYWEHDKRITANKRRAAAQIKQLLAIGPRTARTTADEIVERHKRYLEELEEFGHTITRIRARDAQRLVDFAETVASQSNSILVNLGLVSDEVARVIAGTTREDDPAEIRIHFDLANTAARNLREAAERFRRGE